MSKPRAAVFCRRYLPYSETFIYDELRSHERWEADVYTRVRIDHEAFPYPHVFTPGGLLARFAYRLTTHSRKYERLLRERDVRLLHAHFGTSAVYAETFQRSHRLPMIVTFHGYDVGALVGSGKYSPRLWRYWAYAKRILASATLMLCASEELQEIIARLSGRPEATRLYQLGINLSHFDATQPRNGPPRVLMVGRFVEKKGHLDGIAAFAKIASEVPDARLTIIGSGELESEYRSAISKLGIGTRVDFAGVRSHAEVAKVLATTSVMLAPSKIARDGDRDSGILVAKEAGASRVPVIGTKVAGLPQIIDDEQTGFLVDAADVDALADRLLVLLRDPARADRMGAAARAKMEREYDLRASVARLEAVYDEVTGIASQRLGAR